MSKNAMAEVLEAIEEVAKHIGRFDPPMQPNYLVLRLGTQADTLRRLISEQEQGAVALWQKRHADETDGMWQDTDAADATWWVAQKSNHGWEVRNIYATPQGAKAGQCEWNKNLIIEAANCLEDLSSSQTPKTSSARQIAADLKMMLATLQLGSAA
jgi:hypothetical protein